MDEGTLRQLQLAQLEIAKEIKRVCDANQIDYFMDSGTLLGAVRHQGFIPWDDDMDIGMLRTDYERFISIAPESLKEGFFLQTWDTDPSFPFCYAKVLKEGTEYIEATSAGTEKRNEIFVDVFAYDSLETEKAEESSLKRMQRYRRILMMKSGIKPWKGNASKVYNFVKRVAYLYYRFIGVFCSREKLKDLYYQERTKYNHSNNTRFYYNGNTSEYLPMTFPKAVLESLCELPFEGVFMKAPRDYQTYLSLAYGDYMRLPPEEQREGHHKIISLKL